MTSLHPNKENHTSMSSHHRPLARHVVAAALLSLAFVATACGSSDSSSSATTKAGSATTAASGSTATSTGATPAALPKKIVIGYQEVPNGDLVVKHEKWLETAFGSNVKVEWKVFSSGGDVNTAIQGGSVDIGLVGSSPVSRGLSTGIAYEVPWIFDEIGTAEALVVRNGSGIKTIADLKGKTVATPFASTSHFSLLAALKDAGVDASTVKIIDSENDAIDSAWHAGQIDAAYTWNPTQADLRKTGTVLVTSADLAKKDQATYDLAVVTKKFASAYPAAVKLWVTQEDRAVKLLNSDPATAAKDIAAELNISVADAQEQASELIFLPASEQAKATHLDGALGKDLLAQAEFNKEAGKVDAVAPAATYEAGVDAQFAKAVAAGS